MTESTSQNCPRSASSSERAGEHACLIRAVAGVLREEPALEAVSLDRRHHSVSIATLGRVDESVIKEKVHSRLTELSGSNGNCALLAGNGTCDACSISHDLNLPVAVSVTSDGCSTTISRKTCPTAPRFWRWHNLPWPRFVQRQFELIPAEADDHASEHEWQWQLGAAVACGVSALAAWLLPQGVWSSSLYLLAYLAGGWFAVEEAMERIRQRAIDVHFLMLAVAAGSAGIGAWGEGATLLFLFSFSGALEHYAVGRTRREIRALFHSTPKTASVLRPDGSEFEAPVSTLRPGINVRVRSGGQFPADAVIVSGTTAADESNLTGEAVPVAKRRGDEVFAGTISTWGVVDVEVTRSPGDSALEKIIRLIHDAQQRKAPSQRFTDRFGAAYTYGVLGLAAVMFFVWWLGFSLPAFKAEEGARSAFYRTMTLLVVASPCALVLSIPSAVLAAIAGAARRGILFRGGAAVEKLAEISIVALDKTGTLTTGALTVDGVEVLGGAGSSEDLLRAAFAVESLSNHPLARAIARHGRHEGWKPWALEHSETVPGNGIRATHQGERYWVGARDWVLAESGRTMAGGDVVSTPGLTEVWVAGGALLGRIRLRDEIRPQARGVVEGLRTLKLRSVVLTGDRAEAAEVLKGKVALDEVRAGLKPEGKVEAIRGMAAGGLKVAMVGDGVNDAPSLAAAHVGVAMGARGSDAALEQADLVLMHDRLEGFLEAYRLSCRARRVIRQNLVVSLGTVGVLVLFALAGTIPLTVGVVGHEGSTVVVVLNSLRLLFQGSVEADGALVSENQER